MSEGNLKTATTDGPIRFALVPMALGLIVCGVGGRMGGAVVVPQPRLLAFGSLRRSINLEARGWERTPVKLQQLDIGVTIGDE
jgi:hypothetical protein